MMLQSCHHKGDTPDGLMSHKQMVDFLTEAYIIESLYAVANNYNYTTIDTDAIDNYAELLIRQGVTAEQVNASLAYYSEHFDEYATIQDEVTARVDSMIAAE